MSAKCVCEDLGYFPSDTPRGFEVQRCDQCARWPDDAAAWSAFLGDLRRAHGEVGEIAAVLLEAWRPDPARNTDLDHCPVCCAEEDHCEYDTYDMVEHGTIVQNGSCLRCGAHWYDCYGDPERIRDPEGDNPEVRHCDDCRSPCLKTNRDAAACPDYR